MARGIITTNGTGGVPPKMIITNFEAAQKDFFKPGNEVICETDLGVKIGFLVEGTYDPMTKSVKVTKVIDDNPTIISGSQSGNITIASDKACFIESTGQISGSVSVNGGVLYINGGKTGGNVSISSDSTIIAVNGASVGGGTFDVTGTGSNAVVVLSNSTVNGRFKTNGITYVDLGSNNFNGNVESTKDQYVVIKDNTIDNNKDLIVKEVVVECNISNNTVSGTTTLDPKCQS